jgi:hypothetical protein
VFWPTTGVTQTWTNVRADQAIQIVEGEPSYSTLALKPIPLGRASRDRHGH